MCIFIETQACENERISGCLKILYTMSHKKNVKKIYFCNENLKRNALYAIGILNLLHTKLHENLKNCLLNFMKISYPYILNLCQTIFETCKVKFYFFLHFLILQISLWETPLISRGFLIKEDFWKLLFLISNFTGLKVCDIFICVQNFNSIIIFII